MMGPFGPGLEKVNNFFTANDFPAEEGEVFFYYYQAMDWRNEYRIPVRNCKVILLLVYCFNYFRHL
tara:strand:- start:25879 stop:26076 length:198 start_codon:yes stop_codon:yes gene_type:complete